MPRFWILFTVAIATLETTVFGTLVVRQIVLRIPQGPRAMPDAALLAVTAGVMALTWGIVWLIATARLITEVHSDALFIRYVPFHLNMIRIPLELAESAAAVTYRPILQYGGWGIRYAVRGKAYNVRGNRGVRIQYADGRHLLIGSQMPEGLAEAIEPLIGA